MEMLGILLYSRAMVATQAVLGLGQRFSRGGFGDPVQAPRRFPADSDSTELEQQGCFPDENSAVPQRALANQSSRRGSVGFSVNRFT